MFLIDFLILFCLMSAGTENGGHSVPAAIQTAPKGVTRRFRVKEEK